MFGNFFVSFLINSVVFLQKYVSLRVGNRFSWMLEVVREKANLVKDLVLVLKENLNWLNSGNGNCGCSRETES